MDKEREAELRDRGWIQVGNDLLSPELIELLRVRAAIPSESNLSWDDMVAQVESEEAEGQPSQE